VELIEENRTPLSAPQEEEGTEVLVERLELTNIA
jgi:hypothetical protein